MGSSHRTTRASDFISKQAKIRPVLEDRDDHRKLRSNIVKIEEDDDD